MDLHLRTTPLTTLKVFASHIETMLTKMMRIKDMGGRFLSNYLLEDITLAQRVILSHDEIETK